MTKRKQRIVLVIILLAGAGLAAFFGLRAFNENLMYFYDATQIVEKKTPPNAKFRLGGMVVKNSLQRVPSSLKVLFKVTDFKSCVSVEYEGILPDLFREGQGIVSSGKLNKNNIFIAEEVLAKHDENYMPPEVAKSLKNQNQGKMPDAPCAPL